MLELVELMKRFQKWTDREHRGVLEKQLVAVCGGVSELERTIVSILRERPGKHFSVNYLSYHFHSKDRNIDQYQLKRLISDMLPDIGKKYERVIYNYLDNEIYYLPEVPDYTFDICLPPGWSEQHDTYKNTFYVNHIEKRVQWEKPV